MTASCISKCHRMKIRVLDIIKGTTVDGPGFRTSIYFAGCRHACPGCHNPESWAFKSGTEMDLDEIMKIIREEDFDVTFSGGDPLYHLEEVAELARRVKECGYNLWLYTGFTIEEIMADPQLRAAVGNIDTIVDGPYMESLRNQDLRFRGSSNQRILTRGCPEWPIM